MLLNTIAWSQKSDHRLHQLLRRLVALLQATGKDSCPTIGNSRALIRPAKARRSHKPPHSFYRQEGEEGEGAEGGAEAGRRRPRRGADGRRGRARPQAQGPLRGEPPPFDTWTFFRCVSKFVRRP